MTRQLGAEYIDIDTDAGHVKFAVMEPELVRFDAVEQAAIDAGYTLMIFELMLRGHTIALECATCDGEVIGLEIPQTGQVFELDGEVPLGRDMLLNTSVVGWAGDHPRLAVIESTEP